LPNWTSGRKGQSSLGDRGGAKEKARSRGCDLRCSGAGEKEREVVGVDTPPADPNPQFQNWGAAIATDGNKIVVTDNLYDTDSSGASTDNGIAYIFDPCLKKTHEREF